jgi:hypothetical protein
MSRRRVAPWLLATTLATVPALAQPTPEDRAVAETLFQQGRRLMDEKRFADACPKLEESQRIAPAGGTLLNLAACHEAVGRIAAAWAEYRDAEAQAKKTGRRDREEIARARSEALGPLVPKLIVVVPREVAALAPRITRDGSEIGAAAWGIEIPLDPGPHVVRATAPGHVSWETRVELQPSKTARVAVPVLEPEPAPVASAPASATPTLPPSAPPPGPTSAPVTVPPPAGPGAQRVAGWALTGAGALALGVGAYFGVRAYDKRAESDARCNGSLCTPDGFALNEDAASAARTANLFAIVGVAMLAGGLTLTLTAPTRPSEVSLAPMGPGGALRVRW